MRKEGIKPNDDDLFNEQNLIISSSLLILSLTVTLSFLFRNSFNRSSLATRYSFPEV
jgi:hypothetical protein